MKTQLDLTKIAIIGLFYSFLLSCSATPIGENWDKSSQDEALESIKSSKQGITISETAQRARPVRIPKNAPWLSDPITANYSGGLDAKTTILSILHKQPVRFEMLDNGPPVTANPRAKTYREHLDAIAAQANWAYTVSEGVVTFSNWQVVNYPLDFILGEKQVKLSNVDIISTNNSSSDSDSNSVSSDEDANTNTLSVTNNTIEELDKIMEKILGNSENADNTNQREISYSVVRTTNSVMVSAPPNIQRQVKSALDSINQIAGRSIYLDFDIYSVDLHEQYQRAVDVEVLKQSGISASSKVTSNVLTDQSSAPFVLSLDFNDSGYNSQILLKALAEHGEASLVSQGTLLLKNNEVGNIRTSSLNRWVDIISVSDNESVAPAYKESVVQVLPSIVGDQINLHMVLSDTDNEPYLKSLKREAVINQTNNNNLNIPEYKITIETDTIKLGEQFVIPTEINNGETLMIAGLTRKVYENSKSRNQLLPLVGDSRKRQQRRRETIIVMTAYLLE